jgi:hypothetical protein
MLTGKKLLLIYLRLHKSSIALTIRNLCSWICCGLTMSRSGSNWRPKSFEGKFTPRDKQIKRTIEKEGRQALKNIAKYARKIKYNFIGFYSRCHTIY